MATTTLMRDSIVGDEWIRQTVSAVPIQPCYDDKGQPTGDYLTGPVRLAFASLFTLPAANAMNQNPKFGSMLLFPPPSIVNFQPLYDEYYKVAAAKFADRYQNGQYYGIRSPFRDQGEKMKYGGFTPGSTFLTCTSKFKPPVVDARYNPIVDESKVYPGVWAICAVNGYSYHDQRNHGIAFGLQSVMIIGDDNALGGGPADPKQTFNKVQNVAAPIVRPENLARNMPTGQPPAPGGAPAVPQQHWAPPVPGLPQPPMQPSDDYDFLR